MPYQRMDEQTVREKYRTIYTVRLETALAPSSPVFLTRMMTEQEQFRNERQSLERSLINLTGACQFLHFLCYSIFNRHCRAQPTCTSFRTT
ncbi:hypothetical protein M513_08592 [Trichuris suis]|uniref:Uncharacterized protein n=1 Tax=Trichuris suis TaxID=68888 RepID=A0A085LZX8_9BILA|nr:hypothetical protein M513_08592 [Trichuris suis]